MTLQVIILAAGQGKRMHSDYPKVLHRLGGKHLLEHVILTVASLSEHSPIIVFGHQGNILKENLGHYDIEWIKQKEQLGTGHAVLQAMSKVKDDSRVLILYGDVPLISKETLTKLIENTDPNALGMLTATLVNPSGYGRIKRQSDNIVGVIEEKDANENERNICEINPGIYLVSANYLKKWLPKFKNENAQREYYLTDIISYALQENIAIQTIQPKTTQEILGVNDRIQLAELERIYQRLTAEKLMRQGVTFYDPSRVDIRGEVQIGRDVVIDVNVILEGRVVIGHHSFIGPNTHLRNVELGNHVEIKSNSVLDGVTVGSHCVIGPFARLRPGTWLAEHAHVGNFVEIKNSEIGTGSKINHLSYVGDSEIGNRVNMGAGTITCNYDGVNKHKTIIGDDVHIGSDTQLIAPVTVNKGATIGAGSTIVKDVPPHQLTLTHKIEQRTIKDWQRPGAKEPA